jgi:ribosomal protein S27E
MSLPDTAEYWWDVKKRNINRKEPFLHIKGYDCGHFHVVSTKKLHQVDCRACLKHIENTPELKQRIEQHNQAVYNNKYKFGKCKCGEPMCERINKITNQKFLGCSNYPQCKNTKTI